MRTETYHCDRCKIKIINGVFAYRDQQESKDIHLCFGCAKQLKIWIENKPMAKPAPEPDWFRPQDEKDYDAKYTQVWKNWSAQGLRK